MSVFVQPEEWLPCFGKFSQNPSTTNSWETAAVVLQKKGRSDFPGADKSLARPGRKQAAPVKSVMGIGMDWFG